MAERQSTSEFTKTVLIISVVILIGLNIIFVTRYRRERQKRLALERKQRQHHKLAEQAGFQELSRWQAELKAWPLLEEAFEWMEKNRPRSAVHTLDQALDSYEDLIIAYYLRAGLLFSLGEDERSLDDISFYLEKVPSSIYGRLLRAKLYLKMGESELAREDLQRILHEKAELVEAKELIESIDADETQGSF